MVVFASKRILFHIVSSAVVAVGGVDAFRIISSEKPSKWTNWPKGRMDVLARGRLYVSLAQYQIDSAMKGDMILILKSESPHHHTLIQTRSSPEKTIFIRIFVCTVVYILTFSGEAHGLPPCMCV